MNVFNRRPFQFSVRTLMISATVAAIICSTVKIVLPLPTDFLQYIGKSLLLSSAVSVVPAALIGWRISRTFESVYLGIVWGLLVAIMQCLPEVFAASVPPYSVPPSEMFPPVKVAIGALIGGCVGGCLAWVIKERPRSVAHDDLPHGDDARGRTESNKRPS